MKNINEIIYQYILEQKEPVTIGAVADIKELKDHSRREIGATLLQLQRESAIFRTIRNGKAYYSVSEGASLNPMQQNIDNIENAFNNVTNMIANPKIKEATEVMRAFNEIDKFLGDGANNDHDLDARLFNLNYLERITVSCDEFMIGVPDGFKVLKGVEGRDFILYYPTEKTTDDNYLASPIVFYSGESHVFDSEEQIYLPDTMEYIVENVMLKSVGQMLNTLGMTEIIRLQLDNIKGYYIYQDSRPGANYQVVVVYRGGYKQLRVMINVVNEKEKHIYDKMVLDWLSSIVLKESFPERKKLSDNSFFGKSITKKAVDEWFKYADQWLSQYKTRSNAGMKAEITKYNCNNSRFSFVKIKDTLTLYMQEYADAYNMMLREVEDLIISKSESYNASDKLLYLYKNAENFASLENLSVNIDGNKISLKTNVKSTRKVIKTSKITELLEEEKRIASEKKAEEERIRKEKEEQRKREEEEAKRKKEEEERKAHEKEERKIEENKKIVEQCLKRIEEYRKKVEKAVADKKNTLTKRNSDEIEKLKTEKRFHEEALSGLGIFKLSERRAEKECIAKIRNDIVALSDPKLLSQAIQKIQQDGNKAFEDYEYAVKEFLVKKYNMDYELKKNEVVPGIKRDFSSLSSAEQKRIIIKALKSIGHFARLAEIEEKLTEMGFNASFNTVNCRIKQLKVEGRIWKTDLKGIVHFSAIVYDEENKGKPYTINTKYRNLKCPEIPDCVF